MPRLLIVKLGAIGDVLMVVPAAKAMHASGFEIDWVCGRTVAPLLRVYPWIHVIEIDESGLIIGSYFERSRIIVKVWQALLRRSNYDIIITLYRDPRYRLLTLPLHARRKVHLSHFDRKTQLIPGRHHTSEYARILLAQCGENVTDVEVSMKRAPEVVTEFPIVLTKAMGDRRIVLVPGGARNLLREDVLRRWPIEYYRVLAQKLLDLGYEVILAGGTGDAWVTTQFGSIGVNNLVGKLSLLESVSLFDSADIVISHDTGPLHMAGITRTAIIAIFGPTDPSVFLPQRTNVIAIWGGEGFACRPCYDGQTFAQCLHNGCMHQVTVTMVLQQVETIFIARQEGRLVMPHIVVPPNSAYVTLCNLS